jgi:glycosyltransferase involved in cell wall biosynthesis
MKIGIFTNNYLPNAYGVSTSIETFRRDFEKMGHEVFIFAPEWKGYKDENKNVFRYPSIDIEIKFRFPLPVPYSWKINKILKNLDLDIIHAQHPNLLGTAAMKWARKKKIPLVFTWHTLYDQYTNFVPFLPKKFAANYMIKKAVKFANSSDVVIVPTSSIIPIIKKWGVKKEITSIATGVVEKDFENPDRKSVRGKFKIKDDEVLLLLISRLTEEKNIEFVLEAVTEILKNNEKVKFLVGGEGYLVPKLKEYAADHNLGEKIIFTGEIGRTEIKDYYATGDIFIWGSKSETQGMILTEVMYSGLPVVAVEATGSKSLVINEVNGFLVKDDEEEFSKAVEKLINNKDLRQKFGEASKKIARDSFTSEICAKKMLGVYEKCLNH